MTSGFERGVDSAAVGEKQTSSHFCMCRANYRANYYNTLIHTHDFPPCIRHTILSNSDTGLLKAIYIRQYSNRAYYTSTQGTVNDSFLVCHALSTVSSEPKASTIHGGIPAPEAVVRIHSDIERGFIRAEVISYNDLENCSNLTAAQICA